MTALLRNPDDTAQVFRIIEALSGRNGEHTLARLGQTESGRRLLTDKPDLLDRLLDRAALERLPEGSLGAEYLAFLRREGITTEGLRQASLDGRKWPVGSLTPDLEFLRNRMRDQHDLWHVVTGYHGDLIGEASLLAFSFAQTRNPGVGFIVGIAFLRGREPTFRRLIAEGFVRGLRSEWLPAVDWESLLSLPLAEVRVRLGVGAVPEYAPVRTKDYLAAA